MHNVVVWWDVCLETTAHLFERWWMYPLTNLVTLNWKQRIHFLLLVVINDGVCAFITMVYHCFYLRTQISFSTAQLFCLHFTWKFMVLDSVRIYTKTSSVSCKDVYISVICLLGNAEHKLLQRIRKGLSRSNSGYTLEFLLGIQILFVVGFDLLLVRHKWGWLVGKSMIRYLLLQHPIFGRHSSMENILHHFFNNSHFM